MLTMMLGYEYQRWIDKVASGWNLFCSMGLGTDCKKGVSETGRMRVA